MEKKRKPIRRKVRRTMLLVSVFALLIAGGLGISSMYHIQKQVIQDSSQLGDHATAISAEAMLDQIQDNLLYLAQSKSQLADAKFMRISGYVNEFSGFLSELYTSQESHSGVEVLPPDKENAGQLVLQRILANESVSFADVQEEMELLANAGTVFQAVMESNGNTVENIYFGTESGVLVCYDTYSDRKDTGEGEDYYDYFQSVWYQQAKEAGEVIFTETYMDQFGQGLMMSCAAPFYDEKGSLAGVVAMDIRISHMTGSIISMDSDEDIYAFLLDQQGNVIASPKMDMEQTLQGTSPKQTLEIVNTQLCENNKAQMFVTVWLGILEISTGKILAGNAGHEYPAVKGADGKFALLMDEHDFVLAEIEDMPYEEYELQLEPGSTLYLYTDGVAEAMDSGENLFGTDRLLTALNKNPNGSPKELICQVKEDMEGFVGDIMEPTYRAHRREQWNNYLKWICMTMKLETAFFADHRREGLFSMIAEGLRWFIVR